MHRRSVTLAIAAALSGAVLVGTATLTSAAAPVDCSKVKCVALTFDDGPVADTNRLLDILEERDVKATFYALGENVKRNPATVRNAALAGHQLGNHTWDHPVLTKLSKAEIKSQLSRTDKVITKETGTKPTTLRAPYGAHDAKVRKAAKRPLVHWSVDPLDWKYRDSDRVTKTVKKDTKPGDVVLLHDIHKTTVDAVPGIIKGLEARDFHFVTVDQLFADRKLTNGKVYRHNRGAYKP
jgi:peptidoglycan-N-acetylglucosamine deacetylase